MLLLLLFLPVFSASILSGFLLIVERGARVLILRTRGTLLVVIVRILVLLLLKLELLAQLLLLLKLDLLTGTFLLHPPLLLNMLALQDLCDHCHGVADREGVIPHEARDRLSAIIDLGHLDQHGNVIEEAAIVRVVVPRDDGQAALGLEHVGGGRVVDDDGVFHVATELGHILDKDSVDEGAVLSEEPRRAVLLWVHFVHQGVSVLQKSQEAQERVDH